MMIEENKRTVERESMNEQFITRRKDEKGSAGTEKRRRDSGHQHLITSISLFQIALAFRWTTKDSPTPFLLNVQ